MDKMRLGRTGIMASKSAFGALPIQRVTMEEAAVLLRKAYDKGINFFDTARGYTDSEEKIGNALSDVRKNIFIATKTPATNKKELLAHLEISLRMMKTDYIDVYQLHNPAHVDYDDPDGTYAGMLEAKKKGLVRFIGFTNHRLDLAIDAANSGKFDTIQFPLSMLSSKKDEALIEACRKNDIGLIAMKAMSGGIIRRPDATFAFLRQFGNVLPIWGIQRESELDEFLRYEENPPALDDEMMKIIESERKELSGDFCRGCGYCKPCPAGIPIDTSARIMLMIARMPSEKFLTEEFKAQMDLIDKCTNCGHCRRHCPYGLDTPSLLKRNLKDYREFYEQHRA